MSKHHSLFDRISVKEQAVFARRLSFLIRANVPILEALTILRKQARSKARRRMFDRIISDVSNGQFLSASMEQFRHLFGDFAVDIIRVCEEGGMLDENLNYLADELHKKQVLQRKIAGALVYPLFITLATLGITGLIVVYIFPKILPVFKTIHAALPPSTRALMFISHILTAYGLIIGAVILAGSIAFIIALKNITAFRHLVHRTVLRTPLFGRLMKGYHITNFCRTFGILLKSHFEVVRAAQITAQTSPNLAYRNALEGLAHDIARGRKISEYLERHPALFPEMVIEMVAIGEKTGNLSGTLLYLASYYENEVDEITKNLSSSLEPVLMVTMGLVIGFIAVSVITPIYAITQNLHH
jgi:type IV pilus assembly protein PilC